MAFSPEFLNEMKQKLAEEKSRLVAELSRLAKPGEAGDYETRFEEIGEDEDENATEVEQYVDNLGVEATLEAQLQDVNDALEKMASGRYGLDEETGEPIAEERLRAYPAARTAIA